jgi:uncharacterized protein YaaR (DUF327 family)
MDNFDVIVKNINEKVAQLQEFVSTGNVSDLAEYKKMCGEIRGLLLARDFVLDQKQKSEKFND